MHPRLRNPAIVLSIVAALCGDAIGYWNTPPVAEIANPNPSWLHTGYQLCFNGWPSYDDIGIIFHKWTFGDGSTTGWKSGAPCDCGPNCDEAHRVKHAYSTIGLYVATLYVEDDYGEIDTDGMTLYACSMSWSGSIFIPVNDDDDDQNGRMDNKNNAEPLMNSEIDDDLVPFQLSVNSPRTSPDVVDLGLLYDTSALQVWDQQTRTGRFIGNGDTHETWTPGYNWSKTVYVEGMHGSAGLWDFDPFLRWDYHGGGYLGSPLYGWSEDPSRCQKWITAVHVDMDMAGVADDQTGGGDPYTQETAPGGFIPLGDFVALTVRPVNPDEVEDQDPETWPDMTLSVEYTGNGRIQIWDETDSIRPPHPSASVQSHRRHNLLRGRLPAKLRTVRYHTRPYPRRDGLQG
jgi:hypothetical protein